MYIYTVHGKYEYIILKLCKVYKYLEMKLS